MILVKRTTHLHNRICDDGFNPCDADFVVWQSTGYVGVEVQIVQPESGDSEKWEFILTPASARRLNVRLADAVRKLDAESSD